MDSHLEITMEQVRSQLDAIRQLIQDLRHQEEMDKEYRKQDVWVFGHPETAQLISRLVQKLTWRQELFFEFCQIISLNPWTKEELKMLVDQQFHADDLIGELSRFEREEDSYKKIFSRMMESYLIEPLRGKLKELKSDGEEIKAIELPKPNGEKEVSK